IQSNGDYTTLRTVYVRTRDAAGQVSVGYSDDIIYDPVAPVGTLRVTSVMATTVTTSLSAQDPQNLSGVAAMRVGLGNAFGQARWEPYQTSKVLPRNGVATDDVKVYAQFRDDAGNVSTTICATADGIHC